MDTGPQRVLELVDSGLTQAEVADRLHIAQSTVSRRLKEARDQRNIQYREVVKVALATLAVACLLVLTAAIETIAWRLPGALRIGPGTHPHGGFSLCPDTRPCHASGIPTTAGRHHHAPSHHGPP